MASSLDALLIAGRASAPVACAMCVTLLIATPLLAQFYVRQPDVEKGETELEEDGAIYFGPGEDEDLRQSHELEFKRGRLIGRN